MTTSPQVHAQCSFNPNWNGPGLPPGCQPTGTVGGPVFGDILDIQWYINSVLNVLLPILGLVAVLFIVIDGLKMVIHSSNDTKRKEAQKGVIWAAIGLLATILTYAVITAVIRLVYSFT